ncbi:hypothetical protein DOM22_19050 [Bdellovibrio sp. ZAP7]|uniref:hypothetical protein n=1 Tax=Bdellovibrio sp. ZAP7 TaxID=2231053 RepID=UPI00115BECDC|nr:hypothetical protein [Bdellovibrio sp. ZAP7]QDK47111.1 hypothetical protein DOM22_19050 [Bdellovibrio sp. ZAP7]
MQLEKLNGIRAFVKRHFEKLIFLNCIAAALTMYFHDILYSLDGGGRYVSAMDLWEVGLHGYNDHFFMGGLQNLFYPPLHDFILSPVIKLFSLAFGSDLNHRLLYSIFVFCIFTFFISTIYKLSRQLQSVGAKVFLLVFISWMLSLNIYSYEENLGFFLNFYKVPHIIYYQGLSFQDIFITGLMNQFLSAGFLILSIISLSKRNNTKTAVFIALTILSHFIFGLVAVLYCIVKKVFEKDLKNLVYIGAICFGLTSMFLIPMVVYREFLVHQISMPKKTAFWLTMTAFLFLFFRKPKTSFCLSFTALLLAAVIGYAKTFQKFGLPVIPFHYYRLLYPTILLLILAVAFALNESSSKIRKSLLITVFMIAWFGNFGGHLYSQDIFTTYQPKLESITPSQPTEFGQGRSYMFGFGRPVDFAMEIAAHTNGYRSFFTKGLYWESAPANRNISAAIFKMMGPPTVLEKESDFAFEHKSCQFYTCFFNSFLNMTAATEVWMPSKESLIQYFQLNYAERRKFISCYDDILKSLQRVDGDLKFELISEGRYLNPNTSIVKFHDTNSPEMSVSEMERMCDANPPSDGRIDGKSSPKIIRNSAGDYSIALPSTPGTFHVSLQYFPGLVYDTATDKGVIPKVQPAGILITGSGQTHLHYSRPVVMWISYLITALTILWIAIAFLGRSQGSSRSDN